MATGKDLDLKVLSTGNKIARDIFVRFLLESRALDVDCAETLSD